MRVVFTGGGTGGHFFPLLDVARELKRIAEEERILDLELYYLGPRTVFGRKGLEAELLGEVGIAVSRIHTGKIRRYFSLANFMDGLKIGLGAAEAFWKMFFIMPDVVLAKGGYGSFPVLLAARIYRIPVILHESDTVPGRVNRWAGKFAARIAISFAGAAKFFPAERTALLGVPVRKRIFLANIDQARETLVIYGERPVLYVTGASQGSAKINETIIELLPKLLAHYELIHQVGQANLEEVRLETAPILEKTGREHYHFFGFLDDARLVSAYAVSDLVVARASATLIFEIAASGKPAILIPLKNSAQNHQRENAYEYASTGAAVVVEEDNLTPSVLFNEIQRLIDDPERRKRMSESARAFSRPQAAEVIARELLKIGLH